MNVVRDTAARFCVRCASTTLDRHTRAKLQGSAFDCTGQDLQRDRWGRAIGTEQVDAVDSCRQASQMLTSGEHCTL